MTRRLRRPANGRGKTGFARLAGLAVLAGVVTPAQAMASQPSGQMDALQQAIAICADPAILPADLAASLDGWAQIPLTDALRWRLTADLELSAALGDWTAADKPPLAELPMLHMELIEWQRHRIQQFDEDFPEDYLTIYQHDSGWLLAVAADAEFPNESTCTLSHMAPAPEVIAYAEQGYLGTAPFDMLVGRGMATKFYQPIRPGDIVTDIRIFFREPHSLNLGIVPGDHPVHHASAISIGIELEMPDGARGSADVR